MGRNSILLAFIIWFQKAALSSQKLWVWGYYVQKIEKADAWLTPWPFIFGVLGECLLKALKFGFRVTIKRHCQWTNCNRKSRSVKEKRDANQRLPKRNTRLPVIWSSIRKFETIFTCIQSRSFLNNNNKGPDEPPAPCQPLLPPPARANYPGYTYWQWTKS